MGELLRRLPIAHQPLSLGDLVWGHLSRQLIPIFRGGVYALSGGKIEPHVCENIVLTHAPTLDVHNAKVVLLR